VLEDVELVSSLFDLHLQSSGGAIDRTENSLDNEAGPGSTESGENNHRLTLPSGLESKASATRISSSEVVGLMG
jgi:hypothetical protein